MNSELEDNLILFIHAQSNACNKLKQILPKDKNIQILDISTINNLPPQITSIPALVINNKDLLLGKKVFDYFNNEDLMECLVFNNSKYCSANYSNIDSDIIEHHNEYSSIDANSIADGVPTYQENDSNNVLDIERLQTERDNLFKE
tara:strand:+ start:3046 stop:3483 length:438 start_codon:yes stop_codon:yes gene_type:complete